MGETFDIQGKRGAVVVHCWSNDDPDYVVLIAHGLGEHAGRYGHVAERLVADGAAVYAPDHHGHGRSDGEKGSALDSNAGAPSRLVAGRVGGANRRMQRPKQDHAPTPTPIGPDTPVPPMPQQPAGFLARCCGSQPSAK